MKHHIDNQTIFLKQRVQYYRFTRALIRGLIAHVLRQLRACPCAIFVITVLYFRLPQPWVDGEDKSKEPWSPTVDFRGVPVRQGGHRISLMSKEVFLRPITTDEQFYYPRIMIKVTTCDERWYHLLLFIPQRSEHTNGTSSYRHQIVALTMTHNERQVGPPSSKI